MCCYWHKLALLLQPIVYSQQTDITIKITITLVNVTQQCDSTCDAYFVGFCLVKTPLGRQLSSYLFVAGLQPVILGASSQSDTSADSNAGFGGESGELCFSGSAVSC